MTSLTHEDPRYCFGCGALTPVSAMVCVANELHCLTCGDQLRSPESSGNGIDARSPSVADRPTPDNGDDSSDGLAPHPGEEGACSPAVRLRVRYDALRRRMTQRIHGHEAAIRQLALTGALHLEELASAQKRLIIGESGVGKSHLLSTFLNAMHAECPWFGGLAVASIEAMDLNSIGWVGGRSVGDMLNGVLNEWGEPVRFARAVVVIDEVHWLRQPDEFVSGNSKAKRDEVLASLLALTGEGEIVVAPGRTWKADRALVLLAGAFTGMRWSGDAPSSDDLVRYGFPHELANRICGRPIVLHRLPHSAVMQLLESWPGVRSTTDLASALGSEVHVSTEALQLLATAVTERDLPVRVAGAQLEAAVERVLFNLLEHRTEEGSAVCIGPEDLRSWVRQ